MRECFGRVRSFIEFYVSWKQVDSWFVFCYLYQNLTLRLPTKDAVNGFNDFSLKDSFLLLLQKATDYTFVLFSKG